MAGRPSSRNRLHIPRRAFRSSRRIPREFPGRAPLGTFRSRQGQPDRRSHDVGPDGYAGIAQHLGNKVNFVLVSKVEIGRLREWGRSRGWDKMRLLSSHDNTFNRDFFVEDEKGQRPAVSVFRRAPDGKIHFTYTTEMSRAPGHHRGIDPFSPVWHLYDLLT